MPDAPTLDELIALGKKALPPPWRIESKNEDEAYVVGPLHKGSGPNDFCQYVCGCYGITQTISGNDTAAFIVAACNSSPELASELKALREKMARLAQMCDEAGKHLNVDDVREVLGLTP